MVMCKNSMGKENSYILRLNTDSSHYSWLAFGHTYGQFYIFFFFSAAPGKQQQSLAVCIVQH